MLQKASYKPMMNTLCRRMKLKCLCKSLVFHKKAFCQFSVMGSSDRLNQSGQFLIHLTDVFSGHRKIIPWYVFAFLRFSDPLHIQLIRVLEHGDIRVDIDIVHRLEIPHSRRAQVPDLCIDGTRLIL